MKLENNWQQKTIESLEKKSWPALSSDEGSYLIKACNSLRKKLELKALVFDHQVHGVTGRIIETTPQPTVVFEIEGDWLMTKKLGVGIGILTADCLQIIFYEPENRPLLKPR